jgi:hypothetical protein
MLSGALLLLNSRLAIADGDVLTGSEPAARSALDVGPNATPPGVAGSADAGMPAGAGTRGGAGSRELPPLLWVVSVALVTLGGSALGVRLSRAT